MLGALIGHESHPEQREETGQAECEPHPLLYRSRAVWEDDQSGQGGAQRQRATATADQSANAIRIRL